MRMLRTAYAGCFNRVSVASQATLRYQATAASQKQAPEIIEVMIPHYETTQIKVADKVWVTID